MIAQKILNNNLILVCDENGQEQVVMGKGLRFFNQVGQELSREHGRRCSCCVTRALHSAICSFCGTFRSSRPR